MRNLTAYYADRRAGRAGARPARATTTTRVQIDHPHRRQVTPTARSSEPIGHEVEWTENLTRARSAAGLSVDLEHEHVPDGDVERVGGVESMMTGDDDTELTCFSVGGC